MPGSVTDFLVTGTDTGVGKTVVAAGLVLALRARGLRAVGFKPAETGVAAGGIADSDLLARASGVDEPLARPLLRLVEPLAPPVAAERAGLVLDPSEIDRRVRALRDRGFTIVLEGAGGVAVPLAWGCTALDLAQRLGLSAVVVGRAGLGTLNHTWLTVEALRTREIPVHAIILNGRRSPPDLAEATNPDALARLLPQLRPLVIDQQEGLEPWDVALKMSDLLASIV
jgi:dethiobiotin synthetase